MSHLQIVRDLTGRTPPYFELPLREPRTRYIVVAILQETPDTGQAHACS